jgi:mRNA-degrading endonuclease RelE of RelBE toxin-antitoxin system
MPDNNTKFILKLSLKEQLLVKKCLKKIETLDLEWLDIKRLQWVNNMYRCRIWKIRIIFTKINKKWIIKLIDFRWNIYKNL